MKIATFILRTAVKFYTAAAERYADKGTSALAKTAARIESQHDAIAGMQDRLAELHTQRNAESSEFHARLTKRNRVYSHAANLLDSL